MWRSAFRSSGLEVPAAGALAALLVGIAPVPAALAQEPQIPLEVSGATRVEFDDAAGVWRMEGDPVVLVRAGATVRAPVVRFDIRTQIVAVSGGVSFADREVTLSAASMTVWLREARALAEGGVTATVQQDGEPARLRAMRLAVFRTDGRAVASGGAVVSRGDTVLAGEVIEYEHRAGRATARQSARAQASEATLLADEIDAHFRDEEIAARGNVRLAYRDIEGRAAHAVFRRRDDLAVLSGAAEVRLGRQIVTADTVRVELQARRVTAAGTAHLVAYPAAP